MWAANPRPCPHFPLNPQYKFIPLLKSRLQASPLPTLRWRNFHQWWCGRRGNGSSYIVYFSLSCFLRLLSSLLLWVIYSVDANLSDFCSSFYYIIYFINTLLSLLLLLLFFALLLLLPLLDFTVFVSSDLFSFAWAVAFAEVNFAVLFVIFVESIC